MNKIGVITHAFANNTKTATKVNIMDATPIISTKNNLCLLVLYLLSMNNTILNIFKNLIESDMSKKYL